MKDKKKEYKKKLEDLTKDFYLELLLPKNKENYPNMFKEFFKNFDKYKSKYDIELNKKDIIEINLNALEKLKKEIQKMVK